jgi:hypothetical protein
MLDLRTITSVALELPAGVSDADVYVNGNDGLALVQVSNPTGGDISVQLEPTLTVGGVNAAPVNITVPAGQTCFLPILPPAVYNNTNGEAHILDESEGSLVFSGVRF